MSKNTGMKFMWRAGKLSRRQHIQGPDGKTLCLIENAGNWTDRISDEPAPHRKTCSICLSLHASGKRERQMKEKHRVPTSGQHRRRRPHHQNPPAGERAWEHSPLGRRFAQLVSNTD